MNDQVQEVSSRYMATEHSTADALLDNLELWTGATRSKSGSGRGKGSNSKIELAGIKKLRSLILELAVRGKLVPQNPDDEPASELLKRIEEEKARLVAEGKIKKPKKLAPIGDDEKPFELPQGWEWGRLAHVYDVRDGTHDTPKYHERGVPLVTSKNLYSGVLDLSNVKLISEEDHKKISERSAVNKGDVLFAMIGTIGNPVVVDTDIKFSIKNIALFKPYANKINNMLFLCIQLKMLTDHLKKIAAGGVQKFASLGMLRNLLIALPPLAEQKNIVDKVDELMALCDQIEQQSENQLAAHQQLVETLLATLTDSRNAEELAANWQRLTDHFDLLFSGPLGEWAVDRLKETILQLAVMGKLVSQNPDDEPASELLQRIEEEKAKLVADGMIKKPKKLAPVVDEEKPFELPEGWEWTKLAEITDIQSGIAKGKRFNGQKTVELPYLRVANVQRGHLVLDELKLIEVLESDIQKYSVLPRDLLITEGGDWDKVGRTAIWGQFDGVMLHQNHVFKARLVLEDQNEVWLERYLNSAIARSYFAGSSKQTTNLASINKTQLSNCLLPMPPLAEQHRIVAKVDELFALCDQLKARLQSAGQTQLNLTDALVEQALS